MTNSKKTWDFLPDESRKTIIEELQRFFKSEFDQEIGMIMADVLLDKFLELTAVEIYNEAIDDTERIVEDGISSLKMELYMLKKVQD
jgi:uncharacterized protein (DUF2164 family)